MNEERPNNSFHTQLSKARRKVRGIVRAAVAILFWLHAMGVTHLVRVRFGDDLPRASEISEITLLTLIFFYSYLASNGWWSLLFDLGYVYLFPVWMAMKYGWKLTKLTAGPAGREIAQSVITVPPQNAPPEPKKGSKAPSSQTRDSIARPFQQFALLWCGVVLFSHNAMLTVAGIAVIAIAIAKAAYAMNRFLNGPMEWLNKAKKGIEDLQNKTVENVITQETSSAEFKSSVVSIRIYEAILRWLGNRSAIEKWVQGATLLILVPCYAYISILSGFIDLSVAHLFAIPWPAKEALVDALFMPLAWTDLPHNMIIRTLAGLQVGVLAFLSYEAIFHRISEKADRITNAAEDLLRKLANPDLQSKIVIISPPPKPPVRDGATADVGQMRLK